MKRFNITIKDNNTGEEDVISCDMFILGSIERDGCGGLEVQTVIDGNDLELAYIMTILQKEVMKEIK